MSPELPAKKYLFEFLVKAKNWDGVVKLFADELDIHEKRNSGDRQVGGLFFVTVQLSEEKLTNDFYGSIKKSKCVSIVSDELSRQNGKKVLDEVCRVETGLRRHLLHIPDLAENYFSLFTISSNKVVKDRASSKEVIASSDLNPITSHITLDEILKIFEDDFSWLKHPPIAAELITLIEASADITDLKEKIRAKKKSLTVWSIISQYILEKPTPWSEVKKQLHTLKELRNVAAHFRVIRSEDVENTKSLASEIMGKISKQKVRTATEELALAEFLKGVNDALTKITSTLNNSIRPQLDAFVRAYNVNVLKEATAAAEQFNRALIQSSLNKRLEELLDPSHEKKNQDN